ncbi:DUF2500 domain-containing protein [Paenibacillus pini]|uniref:DUF2500 domain-containing protein n=1 Tax=Paenibacillus pini JCM 16418 TaxID=1236976 RepID=W7Y907_9BACL|nr:DUF2500 domain-containing protein [Paenibacillus pini]GAF07455.1 hypothetical protein JCM16418_1471 [Paenibacillus pini JCM 16418]
MGGDSSFWMFDFFGKVMPIFFVIIVAIILLSAGRAVLQWNRNNKEPLLTVDSRIVSKRNKVTHHHDANDQMSSYSRTHYYLTFEVESGDRMEFAVSGNQYGLCAEGDSGRLTFQGTRYMGFQRYMRVAAQDDLHKRSSEY